MEHRETAAPVVRQLDFTANFNNSKGNLILPEHPQAQLQSKLLALAQSHARARIPPRKSPMPVAPRLAHPVRPKPVVQQPLVKTASPRSRERSNLEQKDGTPKKQKQCNCKSSRCLKLYCECFASGIFCDGCNCINCHNKEDVEERKAAVETILERNPDAFRPKIANSPIGATNGVEHNKGCNCKKSGCLKRYCECYQANILCSDKCKCMDCKNFEGSEERKSLFHEHPASSVTLMHRAVNAAINGAIGITSNKTKNEKFCSSLTYNAEPNDRPQFHQATFLKPDAYSAKPVHVSKPAATELRPSTSSHRSPLAGILQLQHVKDFCTQLVELSAKSAKAVSDGKNYQNQHQENSGGTSSRESADTCSQNERPLSPGTLALMCDERDTAFMTGDSSSTITERESGTSRNSASKNGLEQLHAEQERVVLTKFHSFLNQISHRLFVEGSKLEHQENRSL